MRVYDGANRAIEADFRLTGGNGSLGPSSIAAISEINGSTVIAQSYLNRAGGHGGPAVAGDAVRTDLLTTERPLCAEDWPGFKRGPMRTSWSTPRPTWHPFDCGRPFVAQQYSDMLGRSLDAAGQSFWTARLRTTWSGARVVRGFMNSGEFGVVAAPVVRLHLGLKGGPPMPSAEVRSQMRALRSGTSLARVAEGLLDRGPDASGWSFWVGRVRSGTPPQRLIELFLATSEYRRRVL